MVQTKALKGATDKLTPIADFANAWGVSEKTISNWVEFTYQAFEVLLPSNGPFPEWGIQLLTLCAKHVSGKANLYYAETGERVRLKGTQYVQKIRRLKAEGHFQEFQQFQKSQNFQHLQPADEVEDELFAEVASLVRGEDDQIDRVQAAITQREEERVEKLATFIEAAPQRQMGSLLQRLKAGKALQSVREDEAPSLEPAIDVAFKQLP